MIFTERKTIGVFISKMFRSFDEAFFAAIDREARRLNVDVVVFLSAGYYLSTTDYDLQEKNILRLAPLEKLDGILVVPSTYEKGEFRNLVYEMLDRRINCPVAVVREEAERFNSVFMDNLAALRMMTRHLIEDHHLTKIRMQIGDFENPEVAVRLAGFKEEMAAHGLTVSEKDVCSGNLWTSCGEKAYNAFFSDPEDLPEAVICANDYMAMGLIRVLREKGIRVPEDVIVTGFDHITDWGTDIPSLTTIEPDYQGMVTHAMEQLDREIRGVSESRMRTGLPGKLILGESCGCGKRHNDFYRDMTNRLTALLEAENDQDAAMNNMSIDLGACTDLTELHKALVSRRTENPIVRDQYICLFGTAEKLMDEESEQACLVHAVRDHRDAGMPMITFDRKDVLPPMAERKDEAQVFYFKLLHQMGHNYGYCVIHYDPGKVPSRCFVQTNVLLSIALENIHRQRELMALYEERRISSITDHMTGLLNRRGLLESIEPFWGALTGRDVAFICIDMDYLKHTNDNFGHAAGDVAIRMIGKAIHRSLPKGALGARTGGDEFIIFLPDARDKAAKELVQKFHQILEELNREERRSFTVSASVGYRVVQPGPGITVDECIRASDQVLYQIKENRPDQKTRAAWNNWQTDQMPIPFGTATANAPYYAKPCNERLASIPEALMKLAEGGYTWEHSYVAGKPNYALTLMDYPNIYSFIHTHDLNRDAVRKVLSDAALMVHRKAFTEEEIDLLLDDDQAKAMAHFASPSTIVLGAKGYSEKWMYDHTSQTWKAEGITPGMVIGVMNHYYNPLFVQKAADAFSRKLYNYTNMVVPVKWNQWKNGELRPDGSIEEGNPGGKGVLLDVMEFCQYGNYPTGCESVALYMLLQFYKADVTVDRIYDLLPMGAQPFDTESGVRYGGNPEREFVGDPRKEISYGVFNAPVAGVAEQIRPGVNTKKGAAIDEIKAILDTGNPVLAWYVSAPMRPIMYRWSWQDTDSDAMIHWPGGEHAVVVCGYNENTLVYRDPNAGTTVEIDCETFEKGFTEMGGRIIWYER